MKDDYIHPQNKLNSEIRGSDKIYGKKSSEVPTYWVWNKTSVKSNLSWVENNDFLHYHSVTFLVQQNSFYIFFLI